MILQQIYSGNHAANFIKIAQVLYYKKFWSLSFLALLYISILPS